MYKIHCQNAFDNNTYVNQVVGDLRALPDGGVVANFAKSSISFFIPLDLSTELRLLYAFTGYVDGGLFRGGLLVSADTAKFQTQGFYLMLSINGQYRVLGIYEGDKTAYVTLKDKADSSQVKVAVALPLPPALKDDALIEVKGALVSRIFQNNVGLTFQGEIKPAVEK